MEENKFKDEKEHLAEIVDNFRADGATEDDICHALIGWITADVGPENEGYTRSQLREIFELVNEKNPRDAARKAQNK